VSSFDEKHNLRSFSHVETREANFLERERERERERETLLEYHNVTEVSPHSILGLISRVTSKFLTWTTVAFSI
jgi:hypothetical protein